MQGLDKRSVVGCAHSCARATGESLGPLWARWSKRSPAPGTGGGVGEGVEVAVPGFVGSAVAVVEPEEIDQDFRRRVSSRRRDRCLRSAIVRSRNSSARSNARRAYSAFPLARQRMVRSISLPTWASCSTSGSSNRRPAAKSRCNAISASPGRMLTPAFATPARRAAPQPRPSVRETNPAGAPEPPPSPGARARVWRSWPLPACRRADKWYPPGGGSPSR